MPRTLESMVDNHKVAQERRRAGRPVWDHRLKIADLITDLQNKLEEDPEADIQGVGKQIGERIRNSSWAKEDEKAVKERGGFDSEVMECAEEFEDVTDQDDFELILDRLYDLADADRTWVH